MNANEIFEFFDEVIGEDKLMVLMVNSILLMTLGEKALKEELFAEEDILSTVLEAKERANKFMDKLETMKD